MPSKNQAVMDHYIDEGCHLAPSCLACPFPVCYLDDPQGVALHISRLKEREMVERTAKLGAEDAARELGVAVRTVWRYRQRVEAYFSPLEAR